MSHKLGTNDPTADPTQANLILPIGLVLGSTTVVSQSD